MKCKLKFSVKSSRDSGLSSGDPSPNTMSPPAVVLRQVSEGDRPRPKSFNLVQRSSSSTAIDSMVRRPQRPNSAGKATLSISPRRVREISDPILQMLHTLHKIIYITQVGPKSPPKSLETCSCHSLCYSEYVTCVVSLSGLALHNTSKRNVCPVKLDNGHCTGHCPVSAVQCMVIQYHL